MMKSRVIANVLHGFFFLVSGLVILVSATLCSARNNPPMDLTGTSWVRSPQSITGPGDGTVITLWHSYDFGKKGVVKYTLITTKPAGVVVLPYSYIPNMGVYGTTTQSTIRLFTSKTFDGTYEMFNGKYIHLTFPTYDIYAEIYSDSIKGELVRQNKPKREDWVVRRGAVQCEQTVPLCVTNARQYDDNGKYAVPANNLMIGAWKAVEVSDKGIERTISNVTFYPSGVVEIGLDQKITRYWKYHTCPK